MVTSVTCIFVVLLLEADLSLHTLSESPCGSLVVYVIPESSSLLPEVQTLNVLLYLASKSDVCLLLSFSYFITRITV